MFFDVVIIIIGVLVTCLAYFLREVACAMDADDRPEWRGDGN
jgi:hypothetical protein